MIDLFELVKKINGETVAVGDSSVDNGINQNTHELGNLYIQIQDELIKSVRLLSRYEWSMNENGKIALHYLEIDRRHLEEQIELAKSSNPYNKNIGKESPF